MILNRCKVMENSRIPERLDVGKSVCGSMYNLWFNYTRDKEVINKTSRRTLACESKRYSCGYPVPALQRNLCWSRSQEVKFIESAWLGLNIGSYTLHKMDWVNDGEAKKFSGWIIDGQQRLTAIERYWNNEFEVFGLLFSELSKAERMRFMGISFWYYEVELWDEESIRDLYNRMAFGGTAHEKLERA